LWLLSGPTSARIRFDARPILKKVRHYYKLKSKPFLRLPDLPMPTRLAVAAFFLSACGAFAADLPAPVVERLHAAGLPPDSIAVVVRRLHDGAVRVSHRPDASMQPASTLKLVTSLVALETLGPAYSGRSELRIDGEVSGDVLRGDVVLRGLADVDLDAQALQRMLERLRLRGIREIRGDLVLDLGMFRPGRTDVGSAPFDETPEFRYNVIPDALSLNTYLMHLEIASNGDEARVAASPPLEDVAVVSAMRIVDRDCDDWEDGWIHPEYREHVNGTIGIRLVGEFPRDCSA